MVFSLKALIISFLVTIMAVIGLAIPASGADVYYTVQKNDTLYSISRRNNTSIDDLVRLNNLANPNLIFIGQRLKISGAPDTVIYYVKPGDNLTKIARNLNSTVSELASLNNIPNPNLINVGDAIKYNPNTISTRTTPNPATFLYSIRKNDTLSKLARRFETTTSEIRKLNNIPASGQIVRGKLLRIPAPPLVARIDYWAARYGVPADLLKSLTWWESGWNNTVVSSAGAIGIGQLIPSTVDFVSEALIGVRLNPYRVEDNIRMSARFLKYLLTEVNGNTNYALASYYQGLGAVRRKGIYKSSWPYINGIQAQRSNFR